MADSNYTKIFTGSKIFVQRVIFDLKSVGIIPVIKDQTESARLAGFGAGIIPGFQEVYIHDDELEKATSIIKNIENDIEV